MSHKPSSPFIPSATPLVQRTCPHCGAQNHASMSRCQQCGQLLPRYCQRCGFKMAIHDEVCPRCRSAGDGVVEINQRSANDMIARIMSERYKIDEQVKENDAINRAAAQARLTFWILLTITLVSVTAVILWMASSPNL